MPAFTRRHYKVIAATLKEARDALDCDPACVDGIDEVTRGLAAVFMKDNPKFDRVKFYLAVGYIT